MSEVNTPEAMEVEPLLINDYSRLKSSFQRICYGFGHVYNDLCAAVWFSYTLFYLQIVLQIESSTAGILLMIGQVADSVATPLAGFAVDRIGTRRVWHLAGTVAVTAGFCTMFSMHNNNNKSISLPFLYGFSIIIFQIGWAMVQISHLSIIPEIANDRKHTSDLTTIRYTASVCCSIIVHVITLFILKNATNNKIGPDDFFKFKEIALIITGFGVVSTIIYHTGTKFNKYNLRNNQRPQQNQMIKHFLKTPVIYQVSLMYMASRLFTTLCLIYIPLYLNELGTNTNNIDELREKIASMPLITFLFAFFTSIFLKYTTFSDKVVYINGCILCLIGCLLVGIESNLKITIYFLAALIGIGSSATMISSLCLTAAFVKINGYDGGIVYSTVTFTDKLISGAVVLLLQYLECTPKTLCPNFYERVLSYACGCTVIIGLISSMTVQNRSRYQE